jgi:hypothetical protein
MLLTVMKIMGPCDTSMPSNCYANGLIEVRQDSIYPGKDLYVVAQQAVQVYYLSYACQTKEYLQGWDIVHKVSPHNKLPVPIDEDYIPTNPNTHDVEFYQEDGLEGSFEIALPGPMFMEVDNDRADDQDDGDEVQNANDLRMLDRLHLDDDDSEGVEVVPNLDNLENLAYLDNGDSDDETWDPANPSEDDYF